MLDRDEECVGLFGWQIYSTMLKLRLLANLVTSLPCLLKSPATMMSTPLSFFWISCTMRLVCDLIMFCFPGWQ